MAYAPILDPSAYTGSTEPWRRLSVAAAAALQQLAANDAEDLRRAIGWIDDPRLTEEIRQSNIAALHGVRAILDQTGIAQQDLMPRLMQQLREVKAFGELDGGELDDYIGPVSRLIRSGRVELFAG